MFICHSYWVQRNTSLLPKIEVISGTPLDGDIFVQITSMDFGYMVNVRLMFQKMFNSLDKITILPKYQLYIEVLDWIGGDRDT